MTALAARLLAMWGLAGAFQVPADIELQYRPGHGAQPSYPAALLTTTIAGRINRPLRV